MPATKTYPKPLGAILLIHISIEFSRQDDIYKINESIIITNEIFKLVILIDSSTYFTNNMKTNKNCSLNPKKSKSIIIIVLLFLQFTSVFGYEKRTDQYSFIITRSEVIDSMVINNKKVKIQMVSEFSITPNKIEFRNSNLTDIVKTVLIIPEKYIRMIIDHEQLYDFSLVLKQENIKSDTIRFIFLSNLIEALYLKINLKIETKEVFDLVVIDSIKFKSLTNNLLPKKTSINLIARQLDNKYDDIFITGNDTSMISAIDLKEEIAFSNIEEKLKSEYGLGFNKLNKELQFIEIE